MVKSITTCFNTGREYGQPRPPVDLLLDKQRSQGGVDRPLEAGPPGIVGYDEAGGADERRPEVLLPLAHAQHILGIPKLGVDGTEFGFQLRSRTLTPERLAPTHGLVADGRGRADVAALPRVGVVILRRALKTVRTLPVSEG